jgi:hypothetical protein
MLQIPQALRRSPLLPPIFLGLYLVAVVLGVYRYLGFDPACSDVLEYLRWSDHPWLSRASHVPGYPFLIFLLRGALPLGVPSRDVAILLSAISWVLGGWFVSMAAEQMRPGSAGAAAWAFLFFPFTGLPYVAYPISDCLAQTLLAGAFWASTTRRPLLFALFAGYSLVVHKACWPFALLLVLHGMIRKILPAWSGALCGLPFAIYYGRGLAQTGDWLWIVRLDLRINLGNTERWPSLARAILKGIPGEISAPKAALVLLVIGVAAYLCVQALRRRRWDVVPLVLPVLLVAAAANSYTAWTVVRFGKLLAVPASWHWSPSVDKFGSRKAIRILIVLALAASQLVTALYIPLFMAR